MGALVKLATALFGKLSFCALIGAIVGAIVGFLTGLLQVEHVAPLTLAEVLQVDSCLAWSAGSSCWSSSACGSTTASASCSGPRS
jgi:hypothetical protein